MQKKQIARFSLTLFYHYFSTQNNRYQVCRLNLKLSSERHLNYQSVKYNIFNQQEIQATTFFLTHQTHNSKYIKKVKSWAHTYRKSLDCKF
ncbi:hypothetical protein HMPREF9136_0387 [Prevotella dentalis DSM 3688]|uniref:Uncharacterized protein n=1 Tax=Prevotella dentalis (strain ATCC 49559 / DSM 3688 / JCM 13448 / NCTC 12043 / ES 2772) TaxID=908937 RepID=F9D0K9_PREDD|nr:hypothetical protein HMPREF9136_0387 [Prevotella dentalis DSM 3688]